MLDERTPFGLQTKDERLVILSIAKDPVKVWGMGTVAYGSL